jgi:kinesin family protein C2/C3
MVAGRESCFAQDARGVVVVQGAVVRGPCANFEQLYKWNEFGINQRHVASTAMNAESSRSHLIFSIVVDVTLFFF